MIAQMARGITRWLIANHAIEKEDDELYEYAIYSLFITLSPVFMVLCFGILMHMIVQSIVLILPFMTIRKFSGGYHAKSSLVCFFTSCTLLFVMLLAAAHLSNSGILKVFLCLSCISLILLSPIDSANRRLSESEVKKYRQITICIVLFYAALYLLLTVLTHQQYAVCIALGMILPAVLQIPCCISSLQKRL